MKLTALDIHHKEFRHSLRGYSEDEVDSFLDQVADEFDRLFKENIDLAERLEQANERVRAYQSMEATLNNTLLAAQRSAEEIVNKAGLEGDGMLRDAELKAKEIVHNALQKKQTVAAELIRIKHAEEEYRAKYKGLLESQLRNLDEVALPDDVDVLLDDSDGLIGTIDVRPSTTRLIAPTAAYVAPPTTIPAPHESRPTVVSDFATIAPPPSEPVVPVEIAIPEPSATGSIPAAESHAAGVFDYAAESEGGFAAVAAPLTPGTPVAARAKDAQPTGRVSAVSLGEVGPPDLPAGPVELNDPAEFELPGFDVLGERERDTDIEEID
jgi:cell division initiation protein